MNSLHIIISEKLKHGRNDNVVTGCINAAILDCITLSCDQYKYIGQRKRWTSNLNVNGMVCLLQELSAPTSSPSPATVPTPKLPKLKLPFVCITTEQVILHVHACCCFLYTCDIIHKTKQLLVQCQTVISCLASYNS